MHLNDGKRKKRIHFSLSMEVIAPIVVFYIAMTSEFGFQSVLTQFLMILVHLLSKTTYFQGRLFNNVVGIGLSIGIFISEFFGLYRYNFTDYIIFLAALFLSYVWLNLYYLYGPYTLFDLA